MKLIGYKKYIDEETFVPKLRITLELSMEGLMDLNVLGDEAIVILGTEFANLLKEIK